MPKSALSSARLQPQCCPGRKYVKPIYIAPEEIDCGVFAQAADPTQAGGDGAENVWISDEAKAQEEEEVLSVFRKLEQQ